MPSSHPIHLGKDSIGKLLFKLSVPAILAQLVNALYNIVDRLYIGNIPEIGTNALTGVGVTFSIIMIISAFSVLVGMGGAPLVSMYLGDNRKDKAEEIIGNCVTVLFIFSIVLTVVVLLTRTTLLQWFGATKETTLPYADEYMTIYSLGTIFVMFTVGLNPFINAQGYAKIGMLTTLIGAVSNIILDPIFIFTFNMGVRGAALATILSQCMSATWVVIFLTRKKHTLRIKKQYLKPHFSNIRSVFSIGFSPFVIQTTESLLQIAMNINLRSYGGDLAVGAITIINSIKQFCRLPLEGMTQGAQPVISFNYGAYQYDRVRQAFRYLFISCVSFSVAAFAVVELFPGTLISFFTPNKELILLASSSLRIYSAVLFVLGCQTACHYTFVALGQAKYSAFLTILRKIILLIPLVFLLPPFLGYQGVFIAEPIADFLTFLTTVVLFKINFKKTLEAPPITQKRPLP